MNCLPVFHVAMCWVLNFIFFQFFLLPKFWLFKCNGIEYVIIIIIQIEGLNCWSNSFIKIYWKERDKKKWEKHIIYDSWKVNTIICIFPHFAFYLKDFEDILTLSKKKIICMLEEAKNKFKKKSSILFYIFWDFPQSVCKSFLWINFNFFFFVFQYLLSFQRYSRWMKI
jgi:hypothetical protein